MLIFRKRTTLTFLLAGIFLLLFANSASAQSRAGIRGGISVDPEQIYFGGHIDAAEVARLFWFRPNIEVGFGDSLTVAAFNGEFVYKVPTRSVWSPYFGGGPSLVLRTFRGGPGSDSDVGPGFNFVAGVQKQRGLLAEVKIGALDSPGFKLGIGWTW